jgi:hypothetical protein
MGRAGLIAAFTAQLGRSVGNRFIMSAMNADTHSDFKEVHRPEPGPGRQAVQTKAVNNRLFLALWPPDETRAGLVAAHTAFWPHRSALVSPERLHVTVHFIGSVPTSAVSCITKRLAVPIEPFCIELFHESVPVCKRRMAAGQDAFDPP